MTPDEMKAGEWHCNADTPSEEIFVTFSTKRVRYVPESEIDQATGRALRAAAMYQRIICALSPPVRSVPGKDENDE